MSIAGAYDTDLSTAPTDGQFLSWKAATQKWTPYTLTLSYLPLAGGTLTGALTTIAGSRTSPSIYLGPQVGLYQSTTGVVGITDGAGNLLGQVGGVDTSYAYSNNQTPAVFQFYKARGSASAPAVVINNDLTYNLNPFAYGNTGWISAGNNYLRITEPTPSDTAMGGRWEWYACPLGSTTTTRIFDFDYDTGVRYKGVTFLDPNNNMTAYSIHLNAGSAAAPAMQFSTGGGIYKSSGTTFPVVDASGNLLMTLSNAPTFYGGGFQIYRCIDGDSIGVANNFYKSRGTYAAPTGVQSGDYIFQLNLQAYGDTKYFTPARLYIQVTEPTPGDAGMGVTWSFYGAALGSTSGANIFSFSYDAGINFRGINIVDGNRGFHPRSASVATHANYTTNTPGTVVYTTNGIGSLCVYNADTALKRVSQAGFQTTTAHTTITITPFTNEEEIWNTYAFTADATWNLSTANATAGQRFRIFRVATDRFQLQINNGGAAAGTLCTIIGGQYGEFLFDGTNWQLAEVGYISNGGRPQRTATDADYTVTIQGAFTTVIHTAPLTAARACILPIANVPDGSECRVSRKGSGSFNLNVYNNTTTGTLLKGLAINTWADFMFDGVAGAWIETAYGSL